MASASDDEAKKEGSKPQSPPSSDRSITRRNLLRAGLALGIVSMITGIASITKSLFAPANPPSPVEAQTKTPTVTKTQTSTSTVTVTQPGASKNATASSSATTSAKSSQSSSASTTTSTTSSTSSPFPQVMVANVSDLQVNQPVSFAYPLEETPNIIVKLGVKATGGVGPEGDIVAYSVVCQHLGCIVGFLPAGSAPNCDPTAKATGPQGYCCCHGTVYDLVNGAAVTSGPAPRPVPQVILSVDNSGDIYAIGMTPPSIFGHGTGSNDVLNDLQGGTLVSG
jgi:arsenite oxidase small subunit